MHLHFAGDTNDNTVDILVTFIYVDICVQHEYEKHRSELVVYDEFSSINI